MCYSPFLLNFMLKYYYAYRKVLLFPFFFFLTHNLLNSQIESILTKAAELDIHQFQQMGEYAENCTRPQTHISQYCNSTLFEHTHF